MAKWNGSSWSALGSGLNDPVYALAVSGSDLYAGGNLTSAGGAAAYRIAKWNPLAGWAALGSGFNSTVLVLAVLGSDLYAGGEFTTAGGKVSAYVAKAESLVANDVTYARAPGLSVKIPIADIAGDVLFGNPVRVQSLGASAQSATLSWNSTYIFYLPANENNDSFTYTLSNGSATDTGTITVTVAPTGGIAKTVTVEGNTVELKFFGIPELEYDVQRTTSLNEPVTWVMLTTTPLSPGAEGSFSYTDSSAPNGTAYYRSFQH